MNPKALIFDWDNTLVNTWNLLYKAINCVFEKRNHPLWTRDEVKERCQKSARDVFPLMFPDDPQSALDDFYTVIKRDHLKELTPLDDAESLLKFAQTRGIHLGIVSNKNASILRTEIQHLEWTSYFSTIYGSGDAHHDKPHPEMLLCTLHDLHLSPGDAWYVGDTPVDWQCAHHAGVKAIRFGLHDADTPSVTVQTLNALMLLLKK
jgi:phosphoglycolate phosphatase